MNITLQKLTLTNFKGHAELEMEFGEITQIKGHNGAGKSTIGQAVTWCLFGTDTNGLKLDPTPTDRGACEVKAQILIEVDGKPFMLGREIASGKNKFYINEIPQKATEFTTFVEQLVDKNLFLALFTPTFFFTQHWEKQREQLLSFVSNPTNKEVLAELPKLHQDRLPEPLKKYSLDDLDKMHRDNKNKTDKELQRIDGLIDANERAVLEAQEAAKALNPNVTIAEIQEAADRFQKEIDNFSEQVRAQQKYDRELANLEMRFKSTEETARNKKDSYLRAKENPNYSESCGACGRPHTEETIELHKQHWQQTLDGALEAARNAISVHKKVAADLEAYKSTSRPEVADIGQLHEFLRQARENISILSAVERNKQALDEACAKRKEVASSYSASDTMIGLIKDFRAKQAEITARKVSGLFKALSVRLYNETKDGVQKPTFEIEMSGKPYSVLSTAERIKAGLELIGVLSGQSGVVAPVFVDNAESVLDIPIPAGQLIETRVERKKFKVETAQKGALVNE